jgi:hypothetical protein
VKPVGGAIACVVAGFVYAIIVSGLGLRGWFAREDDIRNRWRSLAGDDE